MLQLSSEAIAAEGGVVVVVSKDSPAELAALAQAEGLTFPLLSDPDLALTDALGLRHPGADVMRGGDLARPALLFFDREGRLGSTWLTENWRERLDGDGALAPLRALDAPR